jgi:hypothetical protein
MAETAFGITADLIKQFPELKKVFDLWKAGNTTDAELEYYKTSYYKNLTSNAQTRQKKKASQPGVYAQELEAYKLEQKKRLTARGITVSDATLEDAYLKGLSDSQVDLNALIAAKGKPIGGSTLGSVQSLKEYADAFGMSYSQRSLDAWSQGIFSGTTTADDIQAQIRRDASSAFPVYADQINKGTSVEALTSAYKSSMANILEIDADSITFNDPTLRRALQYIGPDGKPAVKPIWQFETELRQDPRWEKTDGARKTVDSLSLKVLRDLGLA